MGHEELPISIGKLDPKEKKWNPQVMYVEVLLQVVFDGLYTCLIIPSHKNVIYAVRKNDVAALSLLCENFKIYDT